MNLGVSSTVQGGKGDRERLVKDLDHMQKNGINNLRIMAASEGPDSEPFRMTPSLMPSPGYVLDLASSLVDIHNIT